jgi:hypothetical protein
MENIGTNQTGAQWTEREKQLAKKHQVEPKLIRLLTEIAAEQQHLADPLTFERNSISLEDCFSRIEWTYKLAGVLQFNLLTSRSQRYREIGQHILHNLNEEIYEPNGCVAEAYLFIREILYGIVQPKARKSA